MNLRFFSFSLIFLIGIAVSACGTTPQATESFPRPAEGEQSSQATTDTVVANTVDAYKLGQGDKISIQVFDEPDLTITATVSGSGVINYSYLGDLRVAGKTPYELEQHISGLLQNGYLVNPSVNVSVVEFRPFFIGGEVRSPGSYPYQPGLTLDKAIALAGGLTDRASPRRMFVVRAGSASNNQQKVSLSQAIGPGDIISIKEGFF